MKTIDYLKDQLLRPGNLVLVAIAAGFIWWDYDRKKENREAVLDSPVELTATIVGTKGCFKNGKCIDFRYEYDGEEFSNDARVSWEFFNWCSERTECSGMQFRLVVEEGNPENYLVYWEEMFLEKKQESKTDSI